MEKTKKLPEHDYEMSEQERLEQEILDDELHWQWFLDNEKERKRKKNKKY